MCFFYKTNAAFQQSEGKPCQMLLNGLLRSVFPFMAGRFYRESTNSVTGNHVEIEKSTL